MELTLREATGEEVKWYELLMPLLEPMVEMDVLDNHLNLSPPPPLVDPEELPMLTLLTENGIGYLGDQLTYSADLNDQSLSSQMTGNEHFNKQYLNYQDTVSELPLHLLHAPTPPQSLDGPSVMLPECSRTTYIDLAASTLVSTSQKRKQYTQRDGEKAYIKKPPNAFMIFRKEQMTKVKAELNIRNNAEANKVVGHKWKSLSASDQAKYYQLADVEKHIHQEMYPNWSCTDNYHGADGREATGEEVKWYELLMPLLQPEMQMDVLDNYQNHSPPSLQAVHEPNTPSEAKPNISPGLSPNSGPVSLSAAATGYARPDQPAGGDVAVKTDTNEHQTEFRQLRAMSKSHFPISLSTYTSPSWKTEHNAAGERRSHIVETIDHHPLKTSSLSDLSPHSLKAPVPCRPQPIKSTFPWAIPESATWAPMAGGSMVLHPYPKSGLPGFPNMVPTSQNGSLPGYGPQWHKAVKEPTVVFRLKNPSEHTGQNPAAKTQDKKDAQHKDPCDGPLDLSDRGKSKTGQTPLAWQEGLDRRRDKDVSPDTSPSLPPVSQREEVPNHKAVKEQEQNKAAQGKAEQSKKVPALTISLRPVVVLETLNSDLHTQNTSTNGKSPAGEPESSEGQVEEEEEEEEVSVSGQDQDQVSKRRRLSVEADLDLDSDSDTPAPDKKVKMGVRTQEKTSC
nr:transcription factor SOX-30-like [Nerophis lumbriciformis]